MDDTDDELFNTSGINIKIETRDEQAIEHLHMSGIKIREENYNNVDAETAEEESDESLGKEELEIDCKKNVMKFISRKDKSAVENEGTRGFKGQRITSKDGTHFIIAVRQEAEDTLRFQDVNVPESSTTKQLKAPAKKAIYIECQVCGDKAATSKNYGAVTCTACQRFFKNSWKLRNSYKCFRNKNCIVNKSTRNDCTYCRLQKYLSIGMSAGDTSSPAREVVDNGKGIPVYKCSTCARAFVNRITLEKHISLRQGNLYTCYRCQKMFNSKCEYNRHLRMICSNFQFACNICHTFFKDNISLSYHLRLHKKSSFTCDFCNESVVTDITKPLDSLIHSCKVFVYPCTLCKKRFSTTEDLSRHFSTHIKSYSCKICNKLFSIKKRYDSHLLLHAKKSVCNICEYSFTCKKAFFKHMLSNNCAKFICEMCGKVFRYERHFNKHIAKHEEIEQK